MNYRSLLAALTCALATISPLYAQIILASWTFETNTPADVADISSIPVFNASIGSGVGSAVHVSSSADWTTPTGNGSANSLSVNNWSVGDYFQFQVSTTGFEFLALSWSQMGTSTGPGSFKLSYSTNGVTFSDFGPSYNVTTASWTTVSVNPASVFSRDLSSVTALNNDASVYFRIVDSSTTSIGGGSVSSTGSNRIDNFTVTGFAIPGDPNSANAVPEAATWAGGGIGLLGLCVLAQLRRRHQRLVA